MKKKQYKPVYRVRIDFNHDEPMQKPLPPCELYYLNKYSESKVSHTDISDEVAG